MHFKLERQLSESLLSALTGVCGGGVSAFPGKTRPRAVCPSAAAAPNLNRRGGAAVVNYNCGKGPLINSVARDAAFLRLGFTPRPSSRSPSSSLGSSRCFLLLFAYFQGFLGPPVTRDAIYERPLRGVHKLCNA